MSEENEKQGPAKPGGRTAQVATFSIQADLLQRAKERAGEVSRPWSNYICWVIQEDLKRREKEIEQSQEVGHGKP